MRSRWLRAGAALILTLATLAGCRTVPAPALPPSAAWEVRRPQLQALGRFELKGRVAVATGDNGFNANLRWTQDGDHARLSLDGPLGVGGVQISATAGDLQIVTARGEHIGNDAARAELKARLGFDIPLQSLRYWMVGVPEPGHPAQESLDQAQQRLSSFIQDGWRVQYLSYTAVPGETLPARLTLEREAVRVRVLVDAWQL